MKRYPKLRLSFLAIFALSAVAMVAVACGESSESASTDFQSSGFTNEQAAGGSPAGLPGSSAANRSALTTGSGSLASAQATAGATATPAASRPPAAQATTTVFGLDSDELEEDRKLLSDSDNPSPPQAPAEQQPVQFGNERIIVRNVDLSIEVNNPADAIEQISSLAAQEGGWVVRTQNVEVHRGSIDIRVPADRLDSILATLRGLSSNVVSEISTSQDFTEEFTDTSARIRTLQDTVDALRELFSRAEKIEDALTIQKEITRIQSDIEAKQARISFLSQSATFSLVRLTVLALPQSIEVDAGEDKLAAVGRSVRFRAEFTPPQGIDNFRIEWDFGDGTGRQVVTGVAPVDTEGRVISAPVVHTYRDETDSPYIVKVTVNGTGESGAAEGEEVMVVTVNRVPPIEVFAGGNRISEAGDDVTLRGSYTRPDGVESVTYTWDFGDGSAPVTVDADPGATTAEIEHNYANSRPQSYNVVLTVRGETASGSTEGTGSMQVLVEEPESLTTGGFTPGDSGRSAFRTLSSIGAGLGTVAIWIGVLSPIWIIAGVVAFVIYRNSNRNLNRRTSERLASATQQESRDV